MPRNPNNLTLPSVSNKTSPPHQNHQTKSPEQVAPAAKPSGTTPRLGDTTSRTDQNNKIRYEHGY